MHPDRVPNTHDDLHETGAPREFAEPFFVQKNHFRNLYRFVIGLLKVFYNRVIGVLQRCYMSVIGSVQGWYRGE